MAPSRRRASSKASSAAAAAAKRNWKVGDLVLAKVKGFPAWPATVSEPEKWGYSTDWKKVLVYFFGTKQIAFCNPTDVEAFTEEKKKSLLSKRHGRGADFVRAVQEIVDCYEKAKEQVADDDVNSGDDGTISNAGNMEDSVGKIDNDIQLQSPMVRRDSRSECLYVATDNNESHHLMDIQDEMKQDGVNDMDIALEEQVENASSLIHLKETTLVASDSLRKRLIDAPLQSCGLQKRTSVRSSRSTIKVEPCKVQTHAAPLVDSSTNNGDVLTIGTRNGSIKRSRRVRKSPATSVWYHMESPGYSAAFASNISVEDKDSEICTVNSDSISFNDGNILESSCKSEHPNIVGGCLDRGVQLSDRVRPPAQTCVFKKKRKPNRKRVVPGAAVLTASPNRSPGLDIQTRTTLPHSPAACESLPDRFPKADGDEHLPLVKRARVRMGKPPLEEKQLDDLEGAKEESSKEVPINNSKPSLSLFGFSKDLHKANGSFHTDKEPVWNASKYQLCASVDGESALPPSKRLHRALKAMSANAAEENQTCPDAEGITKVSLNGCSDSSDKSSSLISMDNEVGNASEVQNVVSFGDNDANVNGESESPFGLTPPPPTSPSEVLAKASSEPKANGYLVDGSNTSKSDTCEETKIVFKSSLEVKHVDGSSLNTPPDVTKASIKSAHPASIFEEKQGAHRSRLEPVEPSLPLLEIEKFEALESSHESSKDTLKLKSVYLHEDKTAQEQGASEPNHQEQDSSEVDGAGICSRGVDGAHLPVVNADSCKNMQSLMSPLDKLVQATCEVVKEFKDNQAEKEIDVNSMKVLIAAAHAKRQLSLSTSLSDNVVDDKVVCDSVSSPSSVRRGGSYEQVSPPSSTIFDLSAMDTRTFLTNNFSMDVPHRKKSTRSLETDDPTTSSSSHKQKSIGKWATAEAKAVRKSFESMLETLSRTKESIGRGTRLAIDCAKCGIASEVLEILVRNLETESSLHKRIDLFFLVDSITQCSRSQKGDIGDIYPSAVQRMLPRLLSAAAPPGNAARENRRQCLKVLRLWLERKTLPESVIRHHMRELESTDASFTTFRSRRPLRMERAMNDPIREMEGMHVDEYGSNASFQLPGLCMPRMLEDEGSDAEEGSFEAVTPEQDPEIPVEQAATPTSAFEKHCHILEDVDGELEMEDVAPSYEIDVGSANNVTAVNSIDNLHHRFDQHVPLPFAPPLPKHCPPTPPPLPASPPPMAPPPPLPSLSVACDPFTDGVGRTFQTNTHSMRIPSQQHMSQQLETPVLNSAISDKLHYYAPGYRDMGKQPIGPDSFSSSSPSCNTPAPPSVHTGNNVQHIDGGSLHHKSYQLQPPPPTHSNQFSYVHADQRRLSWMEASSSSYSKRFQYGLDMDREDVYDNRERMELTPHDIREGCRIAAPVHSVPVQSHNPEATYTCISQYGPPQESSRTLDRGWSFPPRTLDYHNPRPFRPPEAPRFWRPR